MIAYLLTCFPYFSSQHDPPSKDEISQSLRHLNIPEIPELQQGALFTIHEAYNIRDEMNIEMLWVYIDKKIEDY